MNILLFLLFSFFLLNAQKNTSISDRLVIDGTSFFNLSLKTATKPFSWGKEDFKTLGYIGLGTTALFLIEEHITDFFKNNQSESLNAIERIGDTYGKPAFGTSIAIGLFSYGIFTEDEWSRETATLLASSLLVTGLIQSTLKSTVGRERPSRGNHFAFHPFSRQAGNHSFPSGHTTMAVTTSLVLAHQIKAKSVKYVLYGLAGITMWSRIYSEAHWATDVFLGSVLSYYVVRSNSSFLKSRSLQLQPSNRGLSLVFSF